MITLEISLALDATLSELNNATGRTMFRLEYSDPFIRLRRNDIINTNSVVHVVSTDDYVSLEFYMRAMIKGIAIGIALMNNSHQ